jgi:hypothetical protein
MKKEINFLIIGVVIGLIVGGAVGYFYARNSMRGNFPNRGNFQVDENTQNEIISFFDSITDINQIRDYCNNNRQNCFYYCRSINSEHEICKEINNFTRNRGA